MIGRIGKKMSILDILSTPGSMIFETGICRFDSADITELKALDELGVPADWYGRFADRFTIKGLLKFLSEFEDRWVITFEGHVTHPSRTDGNRCRIEGFKMRIREDAEHNSIIDAEHHKIVDRFLNADLCQTSFTHVHVWYD